MALVPLGETLRFCRERRELSLRETSQLSGVDHAYIQRLETGDKVSPSAEIVEKLIKALKPSPRNAQMIEYLVNYPDGDPGLVRYVLADETIPMEVFEAAYTVRNRGVERPDYGVLIERARRFLDFD